MQLDQLCMGCMGDKGDNKICPICGWNEELVSENPVHLLPGTSINDKYLVGKVLGHGGFGITYLGWDMVLNRKIAIKEYLPQQFSTRYAGEKNVTILTSDKQQQFHNGLEKFLEEAKILAKFEHHQNIVSVYDFFRLNNTAYIVMNYVDETVLLYNDEESKPKSSGIDSTTKLDISINQENKSSKKATKSEVKKTNSKRNKYIIFTTFALVIIVGLICFIKPMLFTENKAKKNNVIPTSKAETNTQAKAITKPLNQAKINIAQVNTDNFPLIKVYFSVFDENNKELNQLDAKCFKINEKSSNNSYDNNQIIEDLRLPNQNQFINLNLVMDISDSMSGRKLQQAKSAASNFLNIVNYNAGDKIEIISFSDNVILNQPFSNNKEYLKTSLNYLNTKGSTAFYDSLYVALTETNKQFGQKCIIAFTDGQDNRSKYFKSDIVNLSKQLSIPIYIIGIGNDVEVTQLEDISSETGGYYKSVIDINDIEGIYKDIFSKQKSQYVLTFTSKNANVSSEWRNIDLRLDTQDYKLEASMNFMPKQAINVDASQIISGSSPNLDIRLNDNLKEELMNSINKYNSYWFAAMSNKNANLIVNSTQIEKDRTNSLIEDMKNKNRNYVGYMTKTIFDLDSVKLELQNGQYVAYISDSEYFNDIYYTGLNSPQPLQNHKLWNYKLFYDNKNRIWLVDFHTALSNFNPVNKREF